MTQRYSTVDVLEFVELAGSKGWYNSVTAAAIKSACERLFSILDDQEKGDVRRLELKVLVRRFANLNPKVSAPSLRTYSARVGKAIRDFVERQTNPTGWQPNITAGRPSPAAERISGAAGKKRKSSERQAGPAASSAAEHQSSRPLYGGLQHSFPLRADWVVRVDNLPMDLSMAEAERLSAWLRTMAVDFTEKAR
ncbi:MAG: hypothetical protein IPK87_17150 [Planctomycetes bacterium]|nr:hypothetical protein [Planctomycetota bacterium]